LYICPHILVPFSVGSTLSWSAELAQKYLCTCCTYLRRLAASKRLLSKVKNPLMSGMTPTPRKPKTYK
jgi:hypothetical protein